MSKDCKNTLLTTLKTVTKRECDAKWKWEQSICQMRSWAELLRSGKLRVNSFRGLHLCRATRWTDSPTSTSDLIRRRPPSTEKYKSSRNVDIKRRQSFNMTPAWRAFDESFWRYWRRSSIYRSCTRHTARPRRGCWQPAASVVGEVGLQVAVTRNELIMSNIHQSVALIDRTSWLWRTVARHK